MDKQNIILFDIDYTLFDTAEYKKSNLTTLKLFEEVEQTLLELSPEHVLGILSEGDLNFQKNKLLQTKIQNYFDDNHTHIVTDKMGSLPEILKKYKDQNVLLVDDKLSVLYNAKQLLPTLKTIWIKRGIYAQQQKPIPGFLPDAVILSLANLTKVMENLA